MTLIQVVFVLRRGRRASRSCLDKLRRLASCSPRAGAGRIAPSCSPAVPARGRRRSATAFGGEFACTALNRRSRTPCSSSVPCIWARVLTDPPRPSPSCSRRAASVPDVALARGTDAAALVVVGTVVVRRSPGRSGRAYPQSVRDRWPPGGPRTRLSDPLGRDRRARRSSAWQPSSRGIAQGTRRQQLEWLVAADPVADALSPSGRSRSWRRALPGRCSPRWRSSSCRSPSASRSRGTGSTRSTG